MSAGEYRRLIYGKREWPNAQVVECWRICQRCHRRDREHMARWYYEHPRKWWQLFRKTELLCDECVMGRK